MMIISDGRPASVAWDYDRVELIADSIVHAIGVSLGVAGAIAIVIVAANSAHAADMPSIVIYTIGLLSMLGFSAAYNIWPISHAKWILRRFDHSAIYVMIAGTYTPFIGQMKGDFVSVALLIGVWLTAVVGVTLKLLLPGRFDRLAVVLYLILGWSGVVVYEPAAAALPSLSIWLLVAGGALYSIGVVFCAFQSIVITVSRAS
jgi:hemolysin III